MSDQGHIAALSDDLRAGAAERLRAESELLPILEDYRSRYLAGRFGPMGEVLHQPAGGRERFPGERGSLRGADDGAAQ